MCFSDFSSCPYRRHIRSTVFHELLYDVIFIKRLLEAKYGTGNVFSNSSSVYELINNSEEKRYDTDLYAIMIYQPHVHPGYISQIPAEGR